MLTETQNHNQKASTFTRRNFDGLSLPKDCVAATAAEVIYWTDSKTFGKYESFTHSDR